MTIEKWRIQLMKINDYLDGPGKDDLNAVEYMREVMKNGWNIGVDEMERNIQWMYDFLKDNNKISG